MSNSTAVNPFNFENTSYKERTFHFTHSNVKTNVNKGIFLLPQSYNYVSIDLTSRGVNLRQRIIIFCLNL